MFAPQKQNYWQQFYGFGCNFTRLCKAKTESKNLEFVAISSSGLQFG
jgi:hypothetical protein